MQTDIWQILSVQWVVNYAQQIFCVGWDADTLANNPCRTQTRGALRVARDGVKRLQPSARRRWPHDVSCVPQPSRLHALLQLQRREHPTTMMCPRRASPSAYALGVRRPQQLAALDMPSINHNPILVFWLSIDRSSAAVWPLSLSNWPCYNLNGDFSPHTGAADQLFRAAMGMQHTLLRSLLQHAGLCVQHICTYATHICVCIHNMTNYTRHNFITRQAHRNAGAYTNTYMRAIAAKAAAPKP
jgi:hypothetical protein